MNLQTTENHTNTCRLIVDPTGEKERLDVYLCDRMEDLSRSFLQRICKDGLVFVNGKEQKKCGYSLKEGDEIIITIPAAITPDIKAENIPLDILYEDDDLLIVNKPKGMVVHPAAGHYSGTLVNAVMYHCKDSLSGINGILRPGIVHRIDRDTSGSLIICKNDISHVRIAEQLKEHTAKRIYKGIVTGHLKEKNGTVNQPVGRDKGDRKKMSVQAVAGTGKEAVTHYEVLRELNGYDHAAFRLETGRTHQIRVHMAYLHHPLLGDAVYGAGNDKFHTEGQVLHAETIGFIHPRTNEYMEFNAPLPEYFQRLLEKLS